MSPIWAVNFLQYASNFLSDELGRRVSQMFQIFNVELLCQITMSNVKYLMQKGRGGGLVVSVITFTPTIRVRSPLKPTIFLL